MQRERITMPEKRTTLKKINQVLKDKYGDLELVHDRRNEYWYFYGEVAMRMDSQAIYQYHLPTLETVLFEAADKLGE